MNPTPIEITLNLTHSYAEELPEFYTAVKPDPVGKPNLLQFNRPLAQELGFDLEKMNSDVVARIFSGNEMPNDARPIAQAYAGHQFGGFSPQLGDGRALLLGEVIDLDGCRRDIALKGSGRTPYSRGGDGKAAVGPVLREYLVGEAMHAMGIPTTRALAAVATGEPVMRERVLPGAVLTRVAASHVRVGTFQYFAARRQVDKLRKLADYVIQRHYPEASDQDEPYFELLKGVVNRQAKLIASWMLVGFIHGVMNTDNMTISGETIDYGPCAFMESYHPQTVFSSIDHDGRYAYVNQPPMALWNLTRFAETLLALFSEDRRDRAITEATSILNTFIPTFEKYWYQGAQTKLGFSNAGEVGSVSEPVKKLADDWLELLAKHKVDFTIAWRELGNAAEGNRVALHALFGGQPEIDAWLKRWDELHHGTETTQMASAIRRANPLYIPRNHLVEEALAAASDNGDMAPFEALLKVVKNPFNEQAGSSEYALPAPVEFTECYRTFCGT